METVEFTKVFVNDDKPYQEILMALSFRDKDRGVSRGDHVNLSAYSSELHFRKRLQHPYKFRVTTEKYVTYCSVREYSAEVGICQMPQWMMEKLELKTGDYVRLESVSLNKGKRVQVRLLDKAMLEITDVRQAFEDQLKNFVVLAEGDRIPIIYNNNQYEIEIVKCEPDCVIDINNVNLEVDFAMMYVYVASTSNISFISRKGLDEDSMSVQESSEEEDVVSQPSQPSQPSKATTGYFCNQGTKRPVDEQGNGQISSNMTDSELERQKRLAFFQKH